MSWPKCNSWLLLNWHATSAPTSTKNEDWIFIKLIAPKMYFFIIFSSRILVYATIFIWPPFMRSVYLILIGFMKLHSKYKVTWKCGWEIVVMMICIQIYNFNQDYSTFCFTSTNLYNCYKCGTMQTRNILFSFSSNVASTIFCVMTYHLI